MYEPDPTDRKETIKVRVHRAGLARLQAAN